MAEVNGGLLGDHLLAALMAALMAALVAVLMAALMAAPIAALMAATDGGTNLRSISESGPSGSCLTAEVGIIEFRLLVVFTKTPIRNNHPWPMPESGEAPACAGILAQS